MILRSPRNLSGKGVVMKRLLSLAFVLVVAISNFASEGHAVPIEVAFTGVIDSVTDPGGVLPGGIGIGTPFSGTYTFDSVGTPNPILNFPPSFVFYLPNGSISAVVGGNSFSSTSPIGNAQFNDQPGGPGQLLGDAWFSSPEGCDCIEPGVFFGDTTGVRISDVTDYFVNTSLTGWDLHDFVLYTNDPNTGQNQEWASGLITSLTIVPEPVPSIHPIALYTLLPSLLVGAGLLGLRRRSSSSE
jgi:hypothetical protein